jgi:hypothetical protein
MPCQLDNSYEDKQWNEELIRHHKEVESILEKVIQDGDTSWAAIQLESERRWFARCYKEIFKGIYSKATLERGVQDILEGKRHV